MNGHSIFINNDAPNGSKCEICGNPAPWQMYCKDCGHVLRFYCDEHAYLSQGNEKLENHIIKAYNRREQPKFSKQIEKAKLEWQEFINISIPQQSE